MAYSKNVEHKALIYLNNQPKFTAKQARWVSYLNLFDYTIKYREGSSNKVADGLSRQHTRVGRLLIMIEHFRRKYQFHELILT